MASALAQPNGSAHKLRRYHSPCGKMLNVHGSYQAHNSMASLPTNGAASFMDLLCVSCLFANVCNDPPDVSDGIFDATIAVTVGIIVRLKY